MRTTKSKLSNESMKQRLTVDLNGLTELLSCGQVTARKIADDAQAKITIGHRTLYDVRKVEEYLYKISA